MAILNIPITKAGKTIAVDTTADIPDEMYQRVLEEGLKVLLNSGMTKVGAITKLEGTELAAAKAMAMEIGEANLAKLRENKLKKRSSGRGASAGDGKLPREVITEAVRLAKEVVKDRIRAAGKRPNWVPMAEQTKLAKAMLEKDPSYYEIAKANLEAQASMSKLAATDDEARKAEALASLAELGGVEEDPKLIEKAAKAKKEKKPLSATQAGIPAKRKPAHQPTAH